MSRALRLTLFLKFKLGSVRYVAVNARLENAWCTSTGSPSLASHKKGGWTWMLGRSGLRVSCICSFSVLDLRYPDLMGDADLHHIQIWLKMVQTFLSIGLLKSKNPQNYAWSM